MFRDLSCNFDSLQDSKPDWHKLLTAYKELGFKSWSKKAQEQVNKEDISQNAQTDLFDAPVLFEAVESKSIQAQDIPTNYRAITTQSEFEEVLAFTR